MKKELPAEIQAAANEIKVTLKPVLGIPVRVWVPALYGLAALVVLYFLVLHSGLTNPGSRLVITSQPSMASVWLGDKRLGSTPLDIFVPQGQADLRVVRPGFQEFQQTDYKIDSNLFLSGFLPRTQELKVTLKADPTNSLAKVWQPVIDRWTMTAPFRADYQPMPVFTQFAADAAAAGYPAADIQAFLLQNAPKVVDPYLYKDLTAALGLDSNAPYEQQVDAWTKLAAAQNRPGWNFTFWVMNNIDRDKRTDVLKSPAYAEKLAAWQKSLQLPAAVRTVVPDLQVLGQTFKGIPSGAFFAGAAGKTIDIPLEAPWRLPVPVTVPSFWLGAAEVTKAQFAAFVREVPAWAPANKAALIAQNLADEAYLRDWVDGAPAPAEADHPVVFVSWFAAKAYADWLSQKVAANGLRADLPTEVEWEWAALGADASSLVNPVKIANHEPRPVSALLPDKLGLRGLMGSVWEWTRDNFAPGEQLLQVSPANRPNPPVSALSEAGVRGGSWAIPDNLAVRPSDRASQPALWATQFLGFRVALEKK